jgi:hypothetical protein
MGFQKVSPGQLALQEMAKSILLKLSPQMNLATSTETDIKTDTNASYQCNHSTGSARKNQIQKH